MNGLGLGEDVLETSSDEEFCCVCDISFMGDNQYSLHLESDQHLQKLVQNGFISKQMFSVYSQLKQKFHKVRSNVCCDGISQESDFTVFVNHLQCAIVIKETSALDAAKHSEEPEVLNDTEKQELKIGGPNEILENKILPNASKLPNEVQVKRKVAKVSPLSPVESTVSQCASPSISRKTARCKMQPVFSEGMKERVIHHMNNGVGMEDYPGSRWRREMFTAHAQDRDNSSAQMRKKKLPSSCSKSARRGSNPRTVQSSKNSSRRRTITVGRVRATVSSSSDLELDTVIANAEGTKDQDYYGEPKFPMCDHGHLDPSLFAQVPSTDVHEQSKAIRTCSLNMPLAKTKTDFCNNYGKIAELCCNFIVYQCFGCKALLTNNAMMWRHYQSNSKHDRDCMRYGSGSKSFNIACLVCQGNQLRDSLQYKVHRSCNTHIEAVTKLAVKPRAAILEAFRSVNNLKTLYAAEFDKAPLATLNDGSSKVNESLTSLLTSFLQLCKLLVLFHKDAFAAHVDIYQQEWLYQKMIPELKFYFDESFSNLLPKKLVSLKGLFLCSNCYVVSSNLFSFIAHAMQDMNHMVLCSFRMHTSCCLSCENPHIVSSFSDYLDSAKKTNFATGEKLQCLSLTPSDDYEIADISKFVDSNDGKWALANCVLKFRCLDKACIEADSLDGLVAVYRHLTSRKHFPPSSTLNLTSIAMECGCCKEKFTSFTSLLLHVLKRETANQNSTVVQID